MNVINNDGEINDGYDPNDFFKHPVTLLPLVLTVVCSPGNPLSMNLLSAMPAINNAHLGSLPILMLIRSLRVQSSYALSSSWWDGTHSIIVAICCMLMRCLKIRTSTSA